MNQRRPGRAAAKPIRAFRLVMPSRIALFCAVCTLGVAVRPKWGGGITLPARLASGCSPDHGAGQGLYDTLPQLRLSPDAGMLSMKQSDGRLTPSNAMWWQGVAHRRIPPCGAR